VHDPQFEYGPWSRGIYTALIALVPLVGILSPGQLTYYVAFLGFGLRLVLEKTGLHQAWVLLKYKLLGKTEQKYLQRRRHEIAMRERDKRYRHSRSRDRDPRLPRNW
jgi:hypothetical protein